MSSTTIAVLDGHNDLPWQMRKLSYDWSRCDISLPQPQLHTDLARIRSGGLRAQFWSVYVPCSFTGDAAVTATLEQIDGVYQMIESYPDDFVLVTSADGVEECLAKGPGGPVASLLGAEGGHSINNSLGTLRDLHRLGVRYMTLTHNDNNDWADSATDEPRHHGLSDFGREVVREMNRIGMLVDLSHVSPDTMRDALATSEAPVIFSHSSTKAVCDHPRNVPDDVLADMAAKGGTCMITFVPSFVKQEVADWRREVEAAVDTSGIDKADFEARDKWAKDNCPAAPVATLDDVVAHVEHAREVAGIDHIGLGGDYDGVGTTPDGLADVAAYPNLLDALRGKGWSEDDLAKLGHRNIIRTLRDAEAVAVRLREERTASLASLTPAASTE
ncbi:dipeptidase [Propionibacteriaceae bacterium Y1685]